MKKVDFSEERCLYRDYKDFKEGVISKSDFIIYLNKHFKKHGILVYSRSGLIVFILLSFLVYKVGYYLLSLIGM